MLNHRRDIIGLLLDPLQFAFWANGSKEDAVNMRLHSILKHLDSGMYGWILIVDFCSVFNTIVPDILHQKLNQLAVPPLLFSARTHQFQCPVPTDTALVPQHCSPHCSSPFTITTFPGDTTVKWLMIVKGGNDAVFKSDCDGLQTWGGTAYLLMQPEQPVDESAQDCGGDSGPEEKPSTSFYYSQSHCASTVDSFRVSRFHISRNLKWSSNVDMLHKKAQEDVLPHDTQQGHPVLTANKPLHCQNIEQRSDQNSCSLLFGIIFRANFSTAFVFL